MSLFFRNYGKYNFIAHVCIANVVGLAVAYPFYVYKEVSKPCTPSSEIEYWKMLNNLTNDTNYDCRLNFILHIMQLRLCVPAYGLMLNVFKLEWPKLTSRLWVADL